MGTWNSRGLRGSTLEDLINVTNEKYREKGIGLIQKIPTPIKPEIFIEYPKNIKCCNGKYYFIFDSAFLVVDSKDKGVIYCYIDDRHNLIQSFEVNSEDMIFFSVGNKSYILEKTYEEMYS